MRRLLIIFIFSIGLISSVLSQSAINYNNYLNNGRLLVIKGEYALGILSMDSALQASPGSLIINKDRGYAEMQLKKYNQAIEDFNKILNKNPNAIDVHLQRGIAYYHISKIDSAMYDIQKVLNDNLYHREAKDYMSYVESGKKLIEQQNRAQLKIEQDKIEQLRLEKTKEKEKIIRGAKNPLAFWYSVFETW
ncbi:MAG: tetratricopeptide repeat protein [Bacteroidota bacterium]